MSDSVKNSVRNPANQPFNITGSRNRTKKNSWWSIHSPSYWRNAGKKTKHASTQQDSE